MVVALRGIMFQSITEYSNRIKQCLVGITFLCFIVFGLLVSASASGQTDEINQWIAALKDPDWQVRVSAAKALGDTKDPRAVEPLIVALKGTEFHVQEGAAEALGKIGAPAVESLILSLKDPDSLAPGAIFPSRFQSRVVGALERIGAPAVDALITALKDPDWQVRWGAAVALGGIKDTRAVEYLITTLKDPNSRVVRGAVGALGAIKDPRAVDPLIEKLKEYLYVDVRRSAACTLGEFKDPRAVEPLIAALRDDGRVRNCAAWALLNDPVEADVLVRALRERNLDVIVKAYPLFIMKGEPGSEDALIQALNSRGSVEMATAFLNSGNAKLKEAAQQWAAAHGYHSTTLFGHWGENASWGSKK